MVEPRRKLRSQGRGDRGWFDETGAARGVAPISVERGVIGVGGGRERGRQDKGSCSQPSLTFCLHISISRDTGANRETLLSLKPEGDQ